MLETSQKSLIKILCFNNQGTRKIKDLQKLSKKTLINPALSVYFMAGLYRKKTKISAMVFVAKSLTDWFIKCSDGIFFPFGINLPIFPSP